MIEEPARFYYEILSREIYLDGNLYRLEGFLPPA